MVTVSRDRDDLNFNLRTDDLGTCCTWTDLEKAAQGRLLNK